MLSPGRRSGGEPTLMFQMLEGFGLHWDHRDVHGHSVICDITARDEGMDLAAHQVAVNAALRRRHEIVLRTREPCTSNLARERVRARNCDDHCKRVAQATELPISPREGPWTQMQDESSGTRQNEAQ